MSYASQNSILSIIVIVILLNSNTTCVLRTPLCLTSASVDIPGTAVALIPGNLGRLTVSASLCLKFESVVSETLL